MNEVVIRGVKAIPIELKELKTQFDCFNYLLSEECLQYLTNQMNLYAHQKNNDIPFVTDA